MPQQFIMLSTSSEALMDHIISLSSLQMDRCVAACVAFVRESALQITSMTCHGLSVTAHQIGHWSAPLLTYCEYVRCSRM